MTKNFPSEELQTPTQPQLDYVEYPLEEVRRSVAVMITPTPETGDFQRIERGWRISGETLDGKKFVVSKYSPDGSIQEKQIEKTELEELQERLFAERDATHASQRVTHELGSAASKTITPDESLPVPTTTSEKVAAGWNVPRSELYTAGILDRPSDDK